MDTFETDIATTNSAEVPGFLLSGPARGRRVLSGIQPSGMLHLGNKFGAIDQHIAAQQANQCLFFIADYHALTTQRDGAALRRASFDVALDYLALGLDPSRTLLYRQHDLPQVTALAWILACQCPVGDLERSVAYKDKVTKGMPANAGLFTYPVLMAADILIVNAEVVPVGQDQLQHIELARRLASRFNQAYGVELFRLPLAQVNRARLVPGLDGSKMSKSYGNTIPIFAETDEYRRLIAAIRTDSRSAEQAKDPSACNVYALLSLVAEPDELQEWAARYRAGGLRYSSVKARLLELLLGHLAPAIERRRELAARPWEVEEILQCGAEAASRIAGSVVDRVLDLVGLDPRRMGLASSTPYGRRSSALAGKGWAE